jgi:L-lactate dehydrogenase complex protein LldG
VTAPETPVGKAVHAAWISGGDGLPALVPYDQEIFSFKETLFAADAAITGTRGAIAETGAIVLWPDQAEPRLMSLVPPIHIAVLDADDIVDTLGEMMEKRGWADGMPTNALLISGPSKTADIELVLAFGVHGPKELIVLIVTDGAGTAQQH